MTPPPTPLGSFLRALRERLQPQAYALPAGNRRRTPGLRREEVALLCGISPTWYAWIEQGRAETVSTPTLLALARGLRLSGAETRYLFELAARALPAAGDSPQADGSALQPLIDAIGAPAYLLDRHWDAVVWNRPAAALFVDWLGHGEHPGGNLLRYVFLDPAAPAFIDDWPARATRLVAEFRADAGARKPDPVTQALIDELCAASPAFAAAWQSQQVRGREGGWRGFRHPARGRCLFRQHTLCDAYRPELKLVVLLPDDDGGA